MTSHTLSESFELRNLTEVQRDRDYFRLTGSVFNGNDVPVDEVYVLVAFYREDGILAGAFRDGVHVTIPPQKMASFEYFSIVSDLPGMQMSGPEADYTYRLFITHEGCTYEYPAP